MANVEWIGWPEVPVVVPPDTSKSWHDLSHVVHADMWRLPILPKPCVSKVFSMPANPMNVTKIEMVAHLGTHVDAPIHFVPDGPTISDIPLDRFYGQGLIIAMPMKAHGEVSAEMLEGRGADVRPGDILILRTDWWRHFGDELYDNHPSLTPSAADWLVERRVKVLAIDFATPDLAVHRRPKDFDFPVHRKLLSNGVLIAENLTNLDVLADQRVEVMLLPIAIEGSDGAPVRCVARPVSAA